MGNGETKVRLQRVEQELKESREAREKELNENVRKAKANKQKLKEDQIETLKALSASHEKHAAEIKEFYEEKERNDDKMIKMMKEFLDMNSRLLQAIQPASERVRPRYLMQRNSDGYKPYCLLINNSARDENDLTMERLHERFTCFNFEVGMETNIMAEDIKAVLVRIAGEMYRYSCIVIALQSPAKVENGQIVFHDRSGGKTSLRDIWTPFTETSERDGTPKLFFFEVESDVSNCRLTDHQYPGMDRLQHDFLVAHSLGDNSSSKSFLGMLYELLREETRKDVFSVLDDERRNESNPNVTLRSTLRQKVYLKE